MIAVSACLVGDNCKYNGKNNKNENVLKFLSDKEYIKICPEVMGGMPIPRLPSEIKNGRVINEKNEDVTDFFISGAKKALEALKDNYVNLVILKAKSPSCGYGKIYDGTFSGNLISGNGIACQLFIDNGFKVITENEIKEFLK